MDQDTDERTISCAYNGCQRSIYPGRHRRRKYCSEACKQAAYRQRLKALR